MAKVGEEATHVRSHKARMPAYADLNALDAGQDLPAYFWTGDTDAAAPGA